MTVYVEGNLLFDFSSAVRSTKFDEEGAHGLTHCMKAVDFLVLIALSALQPPDLIVLSDGLRRSLPAAGPPGQRWQPFVQDCQVFNLQTWSKSPGALFPVTRLQQ